MIGYIPIAKRKAKVLNNNRKILEKRLRNAKEEEKKNTNKNRILIKFKVKDKVLVSIKITIILR